MDLRQFTSRVARLVTPLVCLLGTSIGGLAQETAPFERVEFKNDKGTLLVEGDVLVEAVDGGILLQARNQKIWPLQPEQIISRTSVSERPKPMASKELAKSVLSELPGRFHVHTTKHYVICYNTSEAYAHWCGALFERLHRAFNNYWSRRGLKLEKTPPLIACIFRNKKSYQAYGEGEVGKGIASTLGYYSYDTNRIAMYDLLEGKRPRSQTQINQLLRQERTVATVIHEATHQLAFNSGMHRRHADIPLWVSEGMAIFFETPDLNSSRGWNTIGDVNRVRMADFKKFQPRRPGDSLSSLVVSNARFETGSLRRDAYAESWAFCYYLIRFRAKEFAAYLKVLQTKTPSDNHSPERRLEDFLKAFGESPSNMEADFLRQTRKIRF